MSKHSIKVVEQLKKMQYEYLRLVEENTRLLTENHNLKNSMHKIMEWCSDPKDYNGDHNHEIFAEAEQSIK